MKSIALALMILGVSGATAMAQTANTDSGANGVTGTTRTKDVGSTTPNASQNRDGAITSSSMEMQRQKDNNAASVPQSATSNQK
jgi:hypothetical protein